MSDGSQVAGSTQTAAPAAAPAAAQAPAQPSAAEQQARIQQFQQETARVAAAQIEQQFAGKFLTPDQISAAVENSFRAKFAPPPTVDLARTEAMADPIYKTTLEDARKGYTEALTPIQEEIAALKAQVAAAQRQEFERQEMAGHQTFKAQLASNASRYGALAPHVNAALESMVQRSIGTPYGDNANVTFRLAHLADPGMQATLRQQGDAVFTQLKADAEAFLRPPALPANVIPIQGSNGQTRQIHDYGDDLDAFGKDGGYAKMRAARAMRGGR